MPLTIGSDNPVMTRDGTLDYHREAVAAMKFAVAASGSERMRWIQIAQAWQDMAHWMEQRDGVGVRPVPCRTARD